MLKTSTSHVGQWVVRLLLLCCLPPMSQAATGTETDKEYTFTLKSWTVTKTGEATKQDKKLRGEYRITFGDTTHCFDHQLEYDPNDHEGWIGWKKLNDSGCGETKVLYGKDQSLDKAFDLEQGFAKQEWHRYKTTIYSEYRHCQDDRWSDTCWDNTSEKFLRYEVKPSYQINSDETTDCPRKEGKEGRWWGNNGYWHYIEKDTCSSTIKETHLGPLTLYQPDPNGSVSLYPPIHANGNESIPFTVWQMDYNGYRLSKDILYHSQQPNNWKTGVFKLTAQALVNLDKEKDGVIELPLKTGGRTEQLTLNLGYVAKPQLPKALKKDIAALEKVLSYTAKQNLQREKEQWAAQAESLDSKRQALFPKTLVGIDAVFLDAPSLLKNNKNPWKVPNKLHPKIFGWIKTEAPNARWLFQNRRQEEVGTAAMTVDLTKLKWKDMWKNTPKPTGAQSVKLYYLEGLARQTIQSRCRPLYQIILSSEFERLKKQQALLVFKRQSGCKGEVVALNPLRTIETADFRRTRTLTIRKPSGITDDFFSKTYLGLTLALRWQGQQKLTTIRITKADVAKGFVSLPKGNYSLSHSSSNTQDNLTLAIVKDSEDFWVAKLTATTLSFKLLSKWAFKQQWRLEVDYPTGLDDATWKQLCPINIEYVTVTEWLYYIQNGAKVVCPYLQETLKVTPKLDGQTIEVDLAGHRIPFELGFKDTHYRIADWTIQLKNQSVLNISEQAVHLGYVEKRAFDLFPNQQSTWFKLLSPKLIYKDMLVSLTHQQQRLLFKTQQPTGLSVWPTGQQSLPQKLTLDLNNPAERLAETQVDSNGLWPLMTLNIQLADGTTLKDCRINPQLQRITCPNKKITLEALAGARLTLKELGDSVRLSQTPTNRALKAVYCGHWSRLFRAQLGRLVIQGASHDTDHLYTAKPDQMELYFTPMPGTKNWWRLDVGTEHLKIPIDGLRRGDRYFHGGASDKPRKDRWCEAFAEFKPVQSGKPPYSDGSSIPPIPVDDNTLHLSLVFVNYDGNWNSFWTQPQMKKTLLALFQKHQNKPVEISLWFAKSNFTQQIEFESRSTVKIKEVITSEAVYDKIHAPISDHPSEEARDIAKPIQTILTQFKAERRWSGNSDHIVVLFAHKLEPDDLQFDWSPLTTANGSRHFVILSTKRIAKRIRKQLSDKGVTVLRFRGRWLDSLKKELDNLLRQPKN